ncbi:FlgD immunoglobulin-like domain containing protein [Orenia marismortui]|uniref:FlgD immunoglobulin-like domain containing protein n=1 Tax=Orenia marismortui TaxID=46469 RepID=UPI000374B0A1|nr:FlgD immunoglobulin-like domain containing protein [Orenia marismortui]
MKKRADKYFLLVLILLIGVVSVVDVSTAQESDSVITIGASIFAKEGSLGLSGDNYDFDKCIYSTGDLIYLNKWGDPFKEDEVVVNVDDNDLPKLDFDYFKKNADTYSASMDEFLEGLKDGRINYHRKIPGGIHFIDIPEGVDYQELNQRVRLDWEVDKNDPVFLVINGDVDIKRFSIRALNNVNFLVRGNLSIDTTFSLGSIPFFYDYGNLIYTEGDLKFVRNTFKSSHDYIWGEDLHRHNRFNKWFNGVIISGGNVDIGRALSWRYMKLNPITIDTVQKAIKKKADLVGRAPLKVYFDNNAESEVGTITTYKWDFENDGNYDWTSYVSDTFSHIYDEVGLYETKLTVFDNQGNSASKIFKLKILAKPAEVDWSVYPLEGRAPLNVNFEIKVSDDIKKCVVDFEGDGNYDYSKFEEILSFDEEYQNSNDNWIAEGSWGKSDSLYYTEPDSWTDSPAGNYGDNNDSSLIINEVDLSESEDPVLEFYHRYNVESYDDFCFVEISEDGGNSWNRLKQYTGSKPSFGKEEVLLADYVGEVVSIRFRLVSDGYRNYDGWYLDQIRVYDNRSEFTHSYEEVGSYKPTLKVIDSLGNEFIKTKEIRVKDRGSTDLSVGISVDKSKGDAPLTVNFDGVIYSYGSEVVLYEWDFDGDGMVDWSGEDKEEALNASYTYENSGLYQPELKITDNNGNSAKMEVEIRVNLDLSFDSVDRYFNPYQDESVRIDYNLDGPADVSIDLVKRDGSIVRSLLEEASRNAGLNSDSWDGRDDNGNLLEPDVYYVVIKANNGFSNDIVDNRDQFDKLSYPGINFSNSLTPYMSKFCDVSWYMGERALVTLYIGDYRSGERVRTFLNKEPLLAGNQSLLWDGINDSGEVAAENSYVFAIHLESIPKTGIILQPMNAYVKDFKVSPYYFNAEDNPYQAVPGMNETEFSITLTEAAKLKVDIYDKSGNKIRSLVSDKYQSNHLLTWDGVNDEGESLAEGLYSVEVRPISEAGLESETFKAYIYLFY